MTICRQWAWKPDDKMKSRKECLQTLIRTAGGDGNLLFNVGPMPDGRIEPRQVERLREMGKWLEKYGECIHGTRGGPFKPGKWGASTCKGNKIYLFVMNWPSDDSLTLPSLDKEIKKTEAPGSGEVTLRQTDTGATVSLAKAIHDGIATIIELTIEGDAFKIAPVDVAVEPMDARDSG
jgi:alpha-L-fucosidase